MTLLKGVSIIFLVIMLASSSISAQSEQQEQPQVAQANGVSDHCYHVAERVEDDAVSMMLNNLEGKHGMCGITRTYLQTLQQAADILEGDHCPNSDYNDALQLAENLRNIICRNR